MYKQWFAYTDKDLFLANGWGLVLVLFSVLVSVSYLNSVSVCYLNLNTRLGLGRKPSSEEVERPRKSSVFKFK